MKALFKNNPKQRIPFLMVILFVLSFLLGRAPLSLVSVLLILLYWIGHPDKIRIQKLLMAATCIILPVLISGCWSDDKNTWWQSFINKLPLLTIGIGLLSVDFHKNQIKQIVWFLNGMVFEGCCWSVLHFIQDNEAITKSYLVAKVMPTVLDDDHIRFSWLIALSILLLNRQLLIQSTKAEKITGGILTLFFIFFLHLLASKTGLLCLYASIFILILYFLIKKETRKISLYLLCLMTAIAFIAYQNFPTLHNRVQYVLYDFSNYSKGKIETGSSDGARVLSMKAGMSIAKNNLLMGTGFGDLKAEVNNWHQQFQHQTLDYERFIPTNEWLIYAAASGLLGVFLFSAGMIILLQLYSFKNIFSVCLLMSLMIPLITDDSLEGQYGVAIFSMVFCLGLFLDKQETRSGSIFA
jgi:hypothetical protein